MKKIFYVLLLAVAAVQLTSCTSRVLVSGSSAVYHPAPPAWASAYGYRASMRYYYVPEISMYYDTFNGTYFWYDGFVWQRSRQLPAIYAGFNFGHTYITQINYSGTTPYRHHGQHYRQYAQNRRSSVVPDRTPPPARRNSAPIQGRSINTVRSSGSERGIIRSGSHVNTPSRAESPRVRQAPTRSSRPQVYSAPAPGRNGNVRSAPSVGRSSGMNSRSPVGNPSPRSSGGSPRSRY